MRGNNVIKTAAAALAAVLLIGCAKTEDPRNTGSTMGEPNASVSEQNSDVLPTNGSSNAPEPTDVTEPTDATGEDADLYKLPTVIGTYTDIYAEIGELEVMHYYPFAEFNSEEYTESKNTTLTLDNCDENNEEKNCAVFIGEDNSACLICRNSSVEKLLFDGYIWDFSETGFNLYYRYPLPEYLHKDIEELSDYGNIADQLAVFEGGMVFEKFPIPFAIKEDKAYRLDKDTLFGNYSIDSIFLISNGHSFKFEVLCGEYFGASEYLYVSTGTILRKNVVPSTEIGYRIIGIDFSHIGSPFYTEKEMTIDEYAEKRLIHGDYEKMALYAIPPFYKPDYEDDDPEYSSFRELVKQKLSEKNATSVSDMIKIIKELGDLK